MYFFPVKLILVTVRKKVLDQGFQEAAAGVPYVTHHRRLGCVLRLVLFAYYIWRTYVFAYYLFANPGLTFATG